MRDATSGATHVGILVYASALEIRRGAGRVSRQTDRMSTGAQRRIARRTARKTVRLVEPLNRIDRQGVRIAIASSRTVLTDEVTGRLRSRLPTHRILRHSKMMNSS